MRVRAHLLRFAAACASYGADMLRVVLITTMLCACSWAFQDHLQPEYSGKSEPVCSTGGGLAVMDIILGALDIAGGVLYDSDSSNRDGGEVLVGNLIEGGLFLASASTGFGWAHECGAARERWTAAQKPSDRPELPVALGRDPNDDPARTWSYWCGSDARCTADRARCHGDCQEVPGAFCIVYRRRDRQGDWFACGDTADACAVQRPDGYDFGSCIFQRAKLEQPAPVVGQPAKAEPAPPRGFFCAVSSSGGLCAREKKDCQTARDAALATVDDLDECTLVETAWCSGDRCVPSKDDCDALVQREGSGAPECVETR